MYLPILFRKMKAAIIFLIVLSSVNVFVNAHSWLECTDYRMRNVTDMYVYDPSICYGHARCGDRQASAGFGVDTGFNNQAVTCQPCPSSPTTRVATYRPGQKVCLAYPTKNHVAAPCTNPYIPENGVTISRTAAGVTNDVFSKTYNHMNGQHTNAVMDYKSFQNCPNFCKNMDKSLCTMCFMLEKDIPEGRYSFSWAWTFNPGTPYTTCWEAIVSKS